MKNVLKTVLIVTIFVGLVACWTPPDNVQPSKTIGVQGGTLSSADGNMTLEIPAGTFSDPTTVSLEPVTNPNAPWGTGNGWRLNGLEVQFKAIKVKLKYPDDFPAEWLGVAIQDTSGAWLGFRHAIVDETTKTISVTLPAQTPPASVQGLDTRVLRRGFSKNNIFTFSSLFVTPQHQSVKVKATQDFLLQVCDLLDKSNPNDDLAPLLPELSNCFQIKPENSPQTWTVNGIKNGNLSSVGAIIGDPVGATYTAPATVPSNNPVQVGVTIHPQGTKTVIAFTNVNITGAGYKVVGNYTSSAYQVCGIGPVVANLSDHVEFKLIPSQTTGSAFRVEDIQNQASIQTNFRLTAAALPGDVVKQDSPADVLNMTQGEVTVNGDEIAVYLPGKATGSACTFTRAGNSTTDPGGMFDTATFFNFKPAAFVNGTQTVSTPYPYGEWVYTITQL